MARKRKPKKWIGVTFTCCKQYGRAYQSDDLTKYVARCPKCLRTLTFLVGREGTQDRFFELK